MQRIGAGGESLSLLTYDQVRSGHCCSRHSPTASASTPIDIALFSTAEGLCHTRIASRDWDADGPDRKHAASALPNLMLRCMTTTTDPAVTCIQHMAPLSSLCQRVYMYTHGCHGYMYRATCRGEPRHLTADITRLLSRPCVCLGQLPLVRPQQ